MVGAELEQMGIAGHEAVGGGAVGTGEEMIVVGIILDHGGCLIGFDKPREFPEGFVNLRKVGVGQAVNWPCGVR